VIDAVLVRAPVGVTYRTLTDLDAWPYWLAGSRSAPSTAPGGPDPDAVSSDRVALELPLPHRVLRRRPWRIEVTVHGWRHDLGVHWDVRGAIELRAEWWLESRAEGTVLHHVVHEAVHGSMSRDVRVGRHRQVMVHAMQAMKDHLELAVALASGRIP
jgi:hypothetical protein